MGKEKENSYRKLKNNIWRKGTHKCLYIKFQNTIDSLITNLHINIEGKPGKVK